MTAPLDPLHEHWPEINRLLDQALTLTPPQRKAWLAALPAEQAPVRAVLERLLASGEGLETARFLDELPPVAVAAQAAGAAAGDTVGPWRLQRLLGEGGMGSVWLAERADGSLKRPVALKLPRLSWAPGLPERMARERDILATLEHPGIARLYDAGMDSLGRPWLALQWVEGEAIDAWVRGRSLSTRACVELLLQVCDAVAYAHGRLVVHRDLKPANVLVDGQGRAVLLDFGIARLLDDESPGAGDLTALVGRALTPAYASPEQLRGEPIGTASDVYSLGVLAFELLAGARPYRLRRGSAAELEEAVLTGDRHEASAIASQPQARRALRGDLDAVLARALETTPSGRYPSVAAFADDLRAWLDGRPVVARAAPWPERWRRWLRRHWVPASAAAAVVLALGVGTAVAWRQAVEAARQRDLALAAAEQARRETARAEAVQEFMVGVFNANTARQDDPQAARSVTARELLDQGARRLDTELADQPAARQELAYTLGRLYYELALFDDSARLYKLSASLMAQISGRGSEDHLQHLNYWLRAVRESGDAAAAHAVFDEARAVAEDPATRPSAGRAQLWRAFSLMVETTDLTRAAAYAARATADARASGQALPIAAALGAEGRIALRLGRFEEAERLIEESLQGRQRSGENHRNELNVERASLAEAKLGRMRFDEARAILADELAHSERTQGPDHLDSHQLRLRLGATLVAAGDTLQALPLLERTRQGLAAEGPRRAVVVALVQRVLGEALWREGRFDEAVAQLQAGSATLEAARAGSLTGAQLRMSLAAAWLARGRPADLAAVRAELDRVAAVHERRGAEVSADDRNERRLLESEWARQRGDRMAAADWLARAEAGDAAQPPGTLTTLRVRLARAAAALDAGDTAAAQQAARQLWKMLPTAAGAAPAVVVPLHRLCARLAQARDGEASPAARQHLAAAGQALAGRQGAAAPARLGLPPAAGSSVAAPTECAA